MYNMILFGPPGSGKGALGLRIMERYNLLHLSTGDLMRNEIAARTAMGELYSKFINHGQLVPDNIVLREFWAYALQCMDSRGILFDGFPRTLYQAQMLDRLLKKKKMKIAQVVSIDVPDEELQRRISKRVKADKRVDDKPEVLQNRLMVYWSQTRPVLTYFRRHHRLAEVDGTGSVEEVSERIYKVIEKHLK